ncbi:SDR family oxidoreductase [Nesterenkonia sp. F]|uniref:SDR family oxidoreductase n=1 Tax=Nesterenkonia sp. F TaxID=795955 RepID=UPI000255D07D|nr:NAD(P)H-binding protein [Nesterenkonia sp. F]
MADPRDDVLVAGASGYLGRHLVRTLHRRGFRVRAVVRDVGRAGGPGAHGAPALEGLVDEWVECDIVAGPLDGLVRPGETVLSALGVTRQKADPWDVDFAANLALLAEAERSSARQFGYVHVMHAERSHSQLVRAKRAFVAALRRSPVPSAVVNPSGYFSDMEELLAMARRGVALSIGDGSVRLNPIHGQDLADFLVDQLTSTDAEDPVRDELGHRHRAWDVGGPEVFTLREILQLCFAVCDLPARIVDVPTGLLRAGLPLLRPAARVHDLAQFFLDGFSGDGVGERTGTHRLEDHLRAAGHGNG